MREARKLLSFEITSRESVSKGTENAMVMYTSGRGPEHIVQVVEAALTDNHRYIYVITTQNRQHIVHLDSIDFIRNNCWSLNLVI